MKLTSLEICVGAGGHALGLEMAGFAPAILIDNDRSACSTLRINRPEWNTVEADIRTFSFSQWKGVDLLTGGLPCPPYSIAGRQLGREDERDLFPTMLNIVSETQPRAVLIENVKGFMAPRFNIDREKIDKSLIKLGYRPYWMMLNAANYGTPQNRWRVFLAALHKSIKGDIIWPIATGKEITVGTAIGDLMAENNWRQFEDWKKQATIVAPTIVGGSKKHGGPDLGPTRARREWATIGIDGMGVANEAPARDFEGMPRLTPRMIARIQGFPDDWQFYGNKTAICRQIGNALPPQLAYAVAASLAPCLK